MLKSKVLGAQLYTVRDHMKSPEALNETLLKIKKMGYSTIQASGLWHIPVGELAAMARSHGLQIVLTHTSYDRFVGDLDQVIQDHHDLGCGIAGIGGLPPSYHHAEGYAAFAKEFSVIAAELARNGLKFSYHNHHLEFQKYKGRLGMEILMEETDPAHFKFTLDTYWVQAGGGDPAAWIRRLGGRVEAIHLKDMTIINEEQIMTEIMEGNLNWAEIFKACEETGVQWYLIERDAGPTEAFDSLKRSYQNLQKIGFA